MGDFTNNILESIAMIAQHAVSSADFDRTIQAVVMSCEDQATGTYKVKYQDSIWLAHSNNLDITYSNGTSVHILVPGNNMSSNKTILGTVNNLGADYANYVNNTESFLENGDNVVSGDSEENGLCSYVEEEKILYEYGGNNNILTVDDAAAAIYFQGSNHMMIKANFRTELPTQQRRAGNYGIKVILQFTEDDTTVERLYILDIDDMQGNPYQFTSTIDQKAYYSIDGQNFIRIKQISIFDQKFSNQDDDKPDDIFISNIELFGVNTLTLEEREGLSLRFKRPQGYIFTNQDSSTGSRNVIAQVRVSGKLLAADLNKIDFYWFKQDSRIDAASPLYHRYGGKGWRCLNPENVYEDGEELKTDEKFLPMSDTLTIVKDQVPIEKMKFKCVAIYNGTQISNTFEMINNDAQYQLYISSQRELVFYSTEDHILLQCIFKSVNDSPLNQNLIDFEWKWVTQTGTVYPLQGDEETLQVYATSVKNYGDYYCSVYYDNDYMGTASVRIFKKQADRRYILSLQNATQLFKYDEAGNSPYQESGLAIPALSFSVVDTTTQTEIPDIQISKIKWTMPIKNTLLENKNQENPDPPEEENPEYATWTNLRDFAYGIKKRYYINQTNNTISLEVTVYNSVMLTAQTNFIFTKEGQLGTNGTGIVCKIVAIDENDQPVTGWLINNITKSTDGASNVQNFRFNWSSLQAVLQKDGEIVTLGQDDTIEWEILTHEDNTWYQISSEGAISLNPSITISASSFDWNQNIGYPANLIKLTITYQGRQYYDIAPIVTIYSYNNKSIDIDSFGGFKYAVYSQDGENPQYDNTYPFSFDFDGLDKTDSSITWEVVGSKHDRKTTVQNVTTHIFSRKTNLTEDRIRNSGLDYSQRYYKPVSIFDGDCVTNAIVVKKANDYAIHFPIHFMLNRYGHKNLNDWDGNAIKIDNEGKYILSPLVGAGQKDSNTNTFYGVLMGTVTDLFNNKTEMGLFGYHNGQRTFFLDSNTGMTELGKAGAGQIIFDPRNNQAEIKSGNYALPSQNNNNEGSGMLINLSNPEIRFGSGNFIVNEAGLSMGKNKITYNKQTDELSINVTTLTWDTQNSTLSANGYFSSTAAKIGPLTIGTSNVLCAYTGSRTNYNKNATGVCLEDNGNFGMGCFNNDQSSSWYGWAHFLFDLQGGTQIVRGAMSASDRRTLFLGQNDRALAIYRHQYADNPILLGWDGKLLLRNSIFLGFPILPQEDQGGEDDHRNILSTTDVQIRNGSLKVRDRGGIVVIRTPSSQAGPEGYLSLGTTAPGNNNEAILLQYGTSSGSINEILKILWNGTMYIKDNTEIYGTSNFKNNLQVDTKITFGTQQGNKNYISNTDLQVYNGVIRNHSHEIVSDWASQGNSYYVSIGQTQPEADDPSNNEYHKALTMHGMNANQFFVTWGGYVHAAGDIHSSSGSFTTTTGSFITNRGNIKAENGYIKSYNHEICSDWSSSNNSYYVSIGQFQPAGTNLALHVKGLDTAAFMVRWNGEVLAFNNQICAIRESHVGNLQQSYVSIGSSDPFPFDILGPGQDSGSENNAIAVVYPDWPNFNFRVTWSGKAYYHESLLTSDERYKNIKKEYNYKDLLMAITPIEYTWKKTSLNGDKKSHLGLGAQTLHKIMTDLGYENLNLVSYDKNSDFFYINYTELQMLTIPVVQEHEREIQKLKEQIKDLQKIILDIKGE